MIKIKIIAVGKIKEKHLKDAIAEYSKRLGAYCKLEILEVPDVLCPENLSDALMQQVKQKEGEKILAQIPPKSFVYALAINGKKLSSEKFSANIQNNMTYGFSEICFIIGGSLGLWGKVLQRADLSLSFSDMTFPHQLMRVILLEQVYRAFRIIANEPYHK